MFKSGSKFLIDSCVDVRKHARHYFGELVAHKKFDSLLHQFTNESERRDIKKTLDTLH